MMSEGEGEALLEREVFLGPLKDRQQYYRGELRKLDERRDDLIRRLAEIDEMVLRLELPSEAIAEGMQHVNKSLPPLPPKSSKDKELPKEGTIAREVYDLLYAVGGVWSARQLADRLNRKPGSISSPAKSLVHRKLVQRQERQFFNGAIEKHVSYYVYWIPGREGNGLAQGVSPTLPFT